MGWSFGQIALILRAKKFSLIGQHLKLPPEPCNCENRPKNSPFWKTIIKISEVISED